MFIALARERHFRCGAEASGVAQPSLSAAIGQLENRLGVTLVWRGSRFRGLMPEGARALEWALRIVAGARGPPSAARGPARSRGRAVGDPARSGDYDGAAVRAAL
jgi:DNA-binding transcriptional LysR family regulator